MPDSPEQKARIELDAKLIASAMTAKPANQFSIYSSLPNIKP